MSAPNTIQGDLYVIGALVAQRVTLPASTVGDAQMNSSSPIGADKSQHQHKKLLAQAYGVAAVSERRVVHIAQAAGSIYRFLASLVLANVGAATCSVDLKKNGTSILTAPISLTTGTAYIPVDASVATPAYVAGDVFEIAMTATAGGGTLGQGFFAEATFRELPN
jgi:hypothetical protein